MSVLRVKAYHDEGAIDNGLDYSADDKKTSISNVMERDDLYTGGLSEHDLSENVKNAFTYSTNPNKTNIGTDGDIDLLVSGINCKPDTAALQFKADMNRFYRLGHKEQNYTRHTKRIMRAKLGKDGNPVLDKDGNMIYDETAPVYHDKDGKCVYQEFDQQMQARTAYMWVLSFYGKKELGYDPDPRLVHQIGMEFCNEFLKDYRCTVSTHVNTDHFHDHIMQSAYAMDGSHKYRDNMENLKKARQICDDLSIKYGLPVIIDREKDRGKSMSWYEWKLRHEGQSWKDQMEADIRSCMDMANSFEEYKDMLRSSGYTLRETEHHITYYMADSDKRCRDNLLSDGFDKDSIIKHYEQKADPERISDKGLRADEIIPQTKPLPQTIRIPRYTKAGRRRGDLEMILLAAIQIIKLIKDAFSGQGIVDTTTIDGNLKDNPCYKSPDWKIQQMEETLRIVQNLGISSMDQLEEMMAKTGSQLSQAKAQVRSGDTAYKTDKTRLAIVNDAVRLISEAKALGVDIDRLAIDTYTPEEIRAEKARLMPITAGQKRSLFVELEKHPEYKVTMKYDQLSYNEAKQAIDFLKGKTYDRPVILVTADERMADRLTKRYDTIYANKIKAMKEKHGEEPMSKEQEEQIKVLIDSNDIRVRNKLNAVAGQNIDTDTMTYYDAQRFIDFCKPDPWKIEMADKESLDYKKVQAIAWHFKEQGQDFKIQRPVTTKDTAECVEFYKNGGKGKIPAVFCPEKPSPSTIKGIREMATLKNIELKIPPEQLTKWEAQEYYNALLFKDRLPEFLTPAPEEISSRNEMLFASYAQDLEGKAQQVAYDLRDVLSQLSKAGIDETNVLTHQLELSQSIEGHEDAMRTQGQLSEKYKTLSRVKYNLGFSQNDYFTYGPGFDRILEKLGYEEADKDTTLTREEQAQEAEREKEEQNRDKDDSGYRSQDSYFEHMTGDR